MSTDQTLIAIRYYLIHTFDHRVLQLHDGFTIGRANSALNFATDGLLSAEHAKFHVRDGTVLIEDLGSTNGTQVNGVTLQARVPAPLKPGDRVELGNQKFIFSDKADLKIGQAPVDRPDGAKFGRRLEDLPGDPVLNSLKEFIRFRNWHPTTTGVAVVLFFEFAGVLFFEWMGWHRDLVGAPVRALIYAIMMVIVLAIHNFTVRRITGNTIKIVSTISSPLVYPAIVIVIALIFQALMPAKWKLSAKKAQLEGDITQSQSVPVSTPAVASPSPVATPTVAPTPTPVPEPKKKPHQVKKKAKPVKGKTKAR